MRKNDASLFGITAKCVSESIQELVDEYGAAMNRNPPRRKRQNKLSKELFLILTSLRLRVVCGKHYRVELGDRSMTVTRKCVDPNGR
jgi:hypothetical protein